MDLILVLPEYNLGQS